MSEHSDKVLQEMGKSSGFKEHVAKTLFGSDCISRQAAIDKLLELGDKFNGNDEVKRGIHHCIAIIGELPSADAYKEGFIAGAKYAISEANRKIQEAFDKEFIG